MTGRRAGLAFRPDLQGLRAVAIMLVVLGHAGIPGFAGGFVGVDVFFVLSGYLITGLLLRERMATGRVAFLRFVSRRLKRLLPALLLMLVSVMLGGLVLLSGHEFSEQTTSVGYAATWTSNLFFAFTTFDYFADLHGRDLFLHTWSLGVEEQFYLVWPLFTVLASAFAMREGGALRRSRLVVVICTVLLASLILSLYWSSVQSLWAFYLMPARVWQFALGALVFVWLDLGRPDGQPASHPLHGAAGSVGPWLGGGLIISSAVFMHPGLNYPGAWALIPSAGAAIVIASGCLQRGRPSPGLLQHHSLVWLGDRSYSIYLWHWPLLMLGFAWGMRGDYSAVAGLVGLSVLLAMASYRWVELPFWKGRLSGIPTLRSIAYAVTVIAVAGMSLVPLGTLHRDDGERAAQFARTARDSMPPIYRMGCDTWFEDAAVIPCVFGDEDAEHTVVLLGDSVGVHWFSLLPAVFREPEWRIVVLTKSACAMVDEDYVYAPAGGVYQVCSDWRNRAITFLQELRPDVVFVGSATTYDFDDDQWVDGSRRILARLAGSSENVVIIPGTPNLSFDGPACLERWLSRGEQSLESAGSICREPYDGKPAQRVKGLLQRAAALEHVELLDLNDLVCPQGHCAARLEGGPVVYRDGRHLTDRFVRAQVPVFRQRLRQMRLAGLQIHDE